MLALIERSLNSDETPSGPNLSIILRSMIFQKKRPIFFEGSINIKLYNSSKYHLLIKKLYKGLFDSTNALGKSLFLTNKYYANGMEIKTNVGVVKINHNGGCSVLKGFKNFIESAQK